MTPRRAEVGLLDKIFRRLDHCRGAAQLEQLEAREFQEPMEGSDRQANNGTVVIDQICRRVPNETVFGSPAHLADDRAPM
jgi:poly(A) polymerase Pap1